MTSTSADTYDAWRKLSRRIDSAVFNALLVDDPCTQYTAVNSGGWGGRYVFRLNS
jgi:hypothetical protein